MTFKLILNTSLLSLCMAVTACGQKSAKTRTVSAAPVEASTAAATTDATAPAQKQMQYVLHKANTRGETSAGWLLAKHSFSFNNYYDPDRMNFGALRVLNDDRIDPAKGFPTHAHNNMEIITIPLTGSIYHKDNMGNGGVVNAGDIQVMSAGTGITHSEANNSKTDTLKLFQVWVLPSKTNVKPRYQQLNGILSKPVKNGFKKLVDPSDSTAAFVHQQTVFSMGYFDKSKSTTYNIAYKGNGVYAFIVEGSAVINGVEVSRRDGIGIWNTDALSIEAKDNLQILLMEVPMLE